MANNIDLSNTQYNDQYNFNNHYSMLLFRPDAIVSQRDLNEEQSEWQNEFRMMGDYVFNNGTILSGMNYRVIARRNSPINTQTNILNKNLINVSGLSAVNSVIDGTNWYNDNDVDIVSKSEKSADYPGLRLHIQNIPKNNGNYVTISFEVQKEHGNLSSLGFSWEGSAQEVNFNIDNIPLDNNTNNSKDKKQTPSNLNDGSVHQVQATFKLIDLSDFVVWIAANNGLDVSQSANQPQFKISELMVNVGKTSKPWQSSIYNKQTPDTDERNTEIQITGGTIYLDGMIRQFNPQNQWIRESGKETLGVYLNRDIVTANQDHRLYDDTQGAVSQGERMADRLQYSIQLTYDDPNSIPIYTLQDGKIVNNFASTGNKKLDTILAERTYDQSGSFRVSGFNFTTKPDRTNNQYMTDVSIDAGIAYVMGYGVYKLAPTVIPTHISDTEGEEDYEPLQFRPSDINQMTMTSEPLGVQPVDQNSVKVFGPVIVQGTNAGDSMLPNGMDHDVYNYDPTAGMDKLPNIFQSQKGASGGVLGTFYIHDPNYHMVLKYDSMKESTYAYLNVSHIISQNDWDHWQFLDSNDKPIEPQEFDGQQGIIPVELNGKWFISYGDQIKQYLIKDGEWSGREIYIDGIANYAYKGPNDVSDGEYPDYTIVSRNKPQLTHSAQEQGIKINTSGNALDGAQIQFGGNTTSQLMPPNPYKVEVNAPTYVSYKYYDATVATVTLDQNGNFNLVKGNPAPKDLAKPKEQVNPDVLRLGYITLMPDDWRSNCEFSAVTRIPFSGLQDLVTRVSNLETTVQNNSLNIQAKENINPAGIQNTLNDDFTTLNTADTTFEAPYTELTTGKSSLPKQLINKYYGFSVAYDLVHGIISTEDAPQTIKPIRPILDQSSQQDYHFADHLITAPIAKTIAQEVQNSSTGLLTIPGNIPIASANGLLDLSPNADDYINDNEYEFQDGHIINNIQLHNWYEYNDNLYPNDDPSTHVDSQYAQGKNYNLRDNDHWSMKHSTGLETSAVGREYAYTSKNHYIHFRTSWLTPGTSDYYILINDQIPVSAISTDNNKGSNIVINKRTYTTINPKKNGEASGKFLLPKGLKTGTVKISLVNSAQMNNPSSNIVSGTYYANGIRNNDKATVLHDYNATDNYGNQSPAPVAQTVKVRRSSVFTQLKLYFSLPNNVTDSPDDNILVQLRATYFNNYPSNVVLAQATVHPTDIDKTTGEADIVFNDPVYIHAGQTIAICIETNGHSYNLAYAYQTQPGVIPYGNGTLYISDGSQYNEVPNYGVLKFELDRASFAKRATISFNNFNLRDLDSKKNLKPISKITLLADYLTPNNTSLRWFIRVGIQSHDKNVPMIYKTLEINRRHAVDDISDSLTNDTTHSYDKNGNPLYNYISSVQLFCETNDSPNSLTDDEDNPGYSRVSPLISADTITLAVSESINSSNRDDDNNSHLDIQTDHSAKYTSGKKKGQYIPVTDIYQAMADADGLYLTRDITSFGNGYNTITTTFDANMSDTHVRVIPIYSSNSGQTWDYYSSWNTDSARNNQSVTPLYSGAPKVLPVDGTFNRYTYKVQVPGTNISNGDDSSNLPHHFKMGLLLYTDSPYHRPMVRRLSNTLTIEDASTSDEINRPYMNNNQIQNYVDFKNDSNNPSSRSDWRTSNDFNNDNNSSF